MHKIRMNTRLLLARILAAISILTMFGVSAQSAEDDPLTLLDDKIAKLAKQHALASINYAIVTPDQPLHVRSLGKADLATGMESTGDIPYRIASISKMIVGIAIMQLVESQQVSLDDSVSDLLPDLAFTNPWADTHPLKLLHLVENTTGWNDISLQEFAYNNEPQLALQQALSLFPESRTSRWPPGTRHAYTNSAAAVAALIVERITGMSFANYAQQYIFSPLDISSASYENHPQGAAQGYSGTNQAIVYKPILMIPAGGLVISTNDLGKLLHAMLVRNPRILTQAGYQRMEYSSSTNAGHFSAGYGIFNYSRFYDGWQFRGHDGALNGWLSELSYSPEFQSGFVVLQNSENAAGFRAVVTAISSYLVQNFSPAEAVPQVNKEHRSAIAGYYRYINPRNDKVYFLQRLVAANKLTANADGLTFTSVFPPGWRRDLTYLGNQQWQNDKGEVVMVEATDPEAGAVLHYGDRVFVKTSALSAWGDKIVLIIWLVCLLIALPVSLMWFSRMRRQIYQSAEQRKVRIALVYAVISAWTFMFFLLFGLASPITRLGGPGWVSVGLMLSSVALAVTTLLATSRFVRLLKQPTGKFAKAYGAVYLTTQIAVVIYLACFGVIGILSWTA